MLTNLTSMAGMLSFPTEEDLNGVALALMRLQDTYKLDTSQLAQGSVLGMKAYRELTGNVTTSHSQKLVSLITIF